MNVHKIILPWVFLTAALNFCACDALKDMTGSDSSDSDAETDDGDDGTCKNLTCAHSLDIEVLLAGPDPFLGGSYVFEIVVPNGDLYFLDCDLPFEGAQIECLSGNTNELSVVMDDTGKMMLLHIVGAPEYMSLSVFYDDSEIGSRVIRPDYDFLYPNGEECSPKCWVGESAIAVAL